MFFGKGTELNEGRYEVEKVLGAGGFGVTYCGRQTRSGQRVAIKTLNKNQRRVSNNFKKLQERFINEAVALAQCHHPNVVKVYPQGFFHNELWCIVMEYIEGETLRNRMEEKQALSESEAIALAQKLGDALQAVHEQGFLHRDIKPDNILLRNGDLKSPVLIDFGLARAYNEERLHSFSTMSGTLGFAPIEQVEGRQEEYGPWTDIYGLAAILYYVVTKQSPMASQYRKLVPEEFKAPKQYEPSLSDHFNQAILSGIALEPKDRPQSGGEWLAELTPKAVSQKAPPEKTTPTISTKSLSQKPTRTVLNPIEANPWLKQTDSNESEKVEEDTESPLQQVSGEEEQQISARVGNYPETLQFEKKGEENEEKLNAKENQNFSSESSNTEFNADNAQFYNQGGVASSEQGNLEEANANDKDGGNSWHRGDAFREQSNTKGTNSNYTAMKLKKKLPPIVYVIALIILGFGGYRVFTTWLGQSPLPPESGISEDLSSRLSAGEEILIQTSGDSEAFLQLKQKGAKAIAEGNYAQAIQHLEEALAIKRNAPETLIYLNNARIGKQKAFEVAVTVPVERNTIFFALEMLRGYAQAQQEINQAGGIKGTPLKLIIADEDDNPDVAKQVVQEIANQEDILAVTGHWSSSTTLGVAPTYDQNQLVLMNPVSSSTKISGISEYVFRTIPSNFIVGATMATYALNQLNSEKIAIFYDSSSNYSLSLREELKTAMFTRGGSVVAEFDFNVEGFLAREKLEQARESQAEAIVLIPSPDIDQALQVVTVNDGELPIIGDLGNLYSIKTLEVGGQDAVGMALPIPWHIQKPGSKEFVRKSRQLWGADVNWATVMAYDALNAIAQALSQNPTREGIQEALSNSDFSASGVMQPIQFLPSGDRDGKLIMVQVQRRNPSRSGTGYDFVP